MSRNTTTALKRTMHPAFLSGVLLSGVGIAFNVSHGWSLGGSDTLRAGGMALAFLGCIALKDSLLGKIWVAIKDRRFGLALMCLLGFLLGSTGSFIAAFGSASEGREERADPRQAQIVAFKTASDAAKDAEKRLAELGRVPTAAEAKASVSRLLNNVDPGIAKRTAGCTNVDGNGAGKKVIAVNREACQPVIEAQAIVAKAAEAEGLRAKLDTARETISKGAPKASDPLVANVSALWAKITGSTGEIDVGAILSLMVAMIVELGAPISWAIWQMSVPATVSRPETIANFATVAERLPSDLDVFRAQLSAPLPSIQGPTVSEFLAAQLPENEPPQPPKGGRKVKKVSENVVQFPAKHPAIAALESVGGSVDSNRELARLMGVCDAESSKRVREVMALLEIQRVGKEKRIAIRSA